ncbi:Pyrophosphatase PpaX [archaeon HR01]|nr:Pyrophosphatase PpaX [archaeon HR01]
MGGYTRPSIIVLDLDGTIIEFRLELTEAKKRVVEAMVEMGMPEDQISVKESIQSLLQKARDVIGDGRAHLLREKVLSIMKEYEMRAARLSKPREGVVELVNSLKNAGFRVAVATNTHRDAAVLALERSGLLDKIDAIVSRDDVSNLKPRGDLLLKVAERMAARPEDILYVGDSVHDFQAAREAGASFIAVEGGIHDRQTFEQAGCKTIISWPLELLRILHGE